MTARVLALRRGAGRATSCRDSQYQPLVAQGSHLGNLLAFRRGENLIAVVPRFNMTIGGDWGDTRLPLPRGVWRNCFTEARVCGRGGARGAVRRLSRRTAASGRARDLFGLGAARRSRSSWSRTRAARSRWTAMRRERADSGARMSTVATRRGGYHIPSTAAPASRIRARAGSPTACMAPRTSLEAAAPAAHPRPAHSVRSRCARPSSTNCTSARSRRREPMTPRPERLALPGRSRHDACGAHAAGDLPGPARLGLRRRRSVRAAAGVRHARGARRVSSRLATSAASPCCSTWSTTTWAPTGTISAATGRISPIACKTPWGEADQLRRRRERRGAPVLHRQRAHVAARLWIRRPAARRGARDFQLRGDPRPRRAGGGGAAAGPRSCDRSFVLIAESDLNDPRLVHPAARGGYGLDAHWSRRFPSRPPSLFHRRERGLLRGLPRSARTSPRRCATAMCIRGSTRDSGSAGTAGRPRGVAPDQLVVCAQNHDQIGNRARGERLSHAARRAAAQGGRGAHAACRRSCPCCFKARSGARARRFCISPTIRMPSLGQAGERRGARGSSRAFAGRGRFPTPRPRRPSSARSSIGRN